MQTLKSIIQDKPKNSRLYTLESMKIIKPDEWYAHVRLTKNPSNLPNEVREAYRELATKYSEKDLPTVYEVRNIAGKLTTKDESIDTLFKIINP